jgi:cell wall-associated NlpC family hydrolase
MPGAIPPRVLAGRLDSYALVTTALGLRGAGYRYGGEDPGGFDCSGFTQYVFAQHHVLLPREVQDQFKTGKPVRARDLRPGDLLFFSTTAPGASHVGIALDRNEFVHAPSSAGVVRIERLGSSYWSPRFVGARRID